MAEDIDDAVTEKVSGVSKFYFVTYDDGRESKLWKDFEDDGNIHIIRGRYRFVFDNGQERGALTARDVPRFGKMVDKVLAKLKSSGFLRKRLKEIERDIEIMTMNSEHDSQIKESLDESELEAYRIESLLR